LSRPEAGEKRRERVGATPERRLDIEEKGKKHALKREDYILKGTCNGHNRRRKALLQFRAPRKREKINSYLIKRDAEKKIQI